MSIIVTTDDPALDCSMKAFLRPLVSSSGPPTERLEMSLHLAKDGFGCNPRRDGPRRIRFGTIDCIQDGTEYVFLARDGSWVKADVRDGHASGEVSRELLTTRPYTAENLVLAPVMEMLKVRGLYGLHASAVSRDGTDVLFTGYSEAGKTTAALAMMQLGFLAAADDKVLLGEKASGVQAYSFTRMFNIDPDLARYYPELQVLEKVEPYPGSHKRLIDLGAAYPGRFLGEIRPTIVVHLESIPAAETSIRHLSPKESFFRLTQQSILSLYKDAATKQLRVLARLAEQSDAYLLRRGTNSGSGPGDVVRHLLDTRRPA